MVFNSYKRVGYKKIQANIDGVRIDNVDMTKFKPQNYEQQTYLDSYLVSLDKYRKYAHMWAANPEIDPFSKKRLYNRKYFNVKTRPSLRSPTHKSLVLMFGFDAFTEGIENLRIPKMYSEIFLSADENDPFPRYADEYGIEHEYPESTPGSEGSWESEIERRRDWRRMNVSHVYKNIIEWRKELKDDYDVSLNNSRVYPYASLPQKGNIPAWSNNPKYYKRTAFNVNPNKSKWKNLWKTTWKNTEYNKITSAQDIKKIITKKPSELSSASPKEKPIGANKSPKTLCSEWINNKLLDPKTGKRLRYGSGKFEKWKNYCYEDLEKYNKRMKKEAIENNQPVILDDRDRFICYHWEKNNKINPYNNRPIKEGGTVYNRLNNLCSERNKLATKKAEDELKKADEINKRKELEERKKKMAKTKLEKQKEVKKKTPDQLCSEWMRDKSRNPETGRKIAAGKPTYKKWEELCNPKLTKKFLEGLRNLPPEVRQNILLQLPVNQLNLLANSEFATDVRFALKRK